MTNPYLPASFKLINTGDRPIVVEKYIVEPADEAGTPLLRVLEGETIYPGRELAMVVKGDDQWRIMEYEG